MPGRREAAGKLKRRDAHCQRECNEEVFQWGVSMEYNVCDAYAIGDGMPVCSASQEWRVLVFVIMIQRTSTVAGMRYTTPSNDCTFHTLRTELRGNAVTHRRPLIYCIIHTFPSRVSVRA